MKSSIALNLFVFACNGSMLGYRVAVHLGAFILAYIVNRMSICGS